jgi:hypothetical protein
LLYRVWVFHVVLFATFGARIFEEGKILEEINHEDCNSYVGIRWALDRGDLRADQFNWAWNSSRAARHRHSLRPFESRTTSNLFVLFGRLV